MTEFKKQLKKVMEYKTSELSEELIIMKKTIHDMEFRLRELEVDLAENELKAKEAKRVLKYHKDIMLGYMFSFIQKREKHDSK